MLTYQPPVSPSHVPTAAPVACRACVLAPAAPPPPPPSPPPPTCTATPFPTQWPSRAIVDIVLPLLVHFIICGKDGQVERAWRYAAPLGCYSVNDNIWILGLGCGCIMHIVVGTGVVDEWATTNVDTIHVYNYSINIHPMAVTDVYIDAYPWEMYHYVVNWPSINAMLWVWTSVQIIEPKPMEVRVEYEVMTEDVEATPIQ